MIWLLRDFDLLAVLLHAATLSCEAISVGGVCFLVCCALRKPVALSSDGSCRRLLSFAAVAMVCFEALNMATSAAVMTSGTGMGLHDLLSASFLRAECLSILFAGMLAVCARRSVPPLWMTLPALALVVSTVWLSHAVSRMDHRLLLAGLTGLHHLGTAAWLGAMPYLLLTLRHSEDPSTAERVVRRFSVMALGSVLVLLAAGTGMAWFYVGTVSGMYGTSYGTMLLVKIYLTLLMLSLGSANWYLLRRSSTLPQPLLLKLRRFSEVEIGLGFTVLLAAASLTSQPPAVDVTQDRASAHDYAERMEPQWPRLKSPALAALAVPSDIQQAIQDQQFNGMSPSDANDIAWSEYNHHWAGVVLLIAGLLAWMSRTWRWARMWPLTFAGLALFILLRADPEAWPLGPRPFWASFSAPDTLEHRLFALLITVFAVFEYAVQSGRMKAAWASLIFPVMCAMGAGLLLTHGHGSGTMKDEVLADASHALIAVFGVTAGWARWLELRAPAGRMRVVAGAAWPIALMLAAAVLLDYREA